MTRVAAIRPSFWWPHPTPLQGSYHDDYLHNIYSDPNAPAVVRAQKQHEVSYIKAVLDRLDATPEGTGTLLDNTLVVWVDEFCHGYSHQHHEIPYVMFSGSNRFFEMGRYLEYSSPVSTNRVLNSAHRGHGRRRRRSVRRSPIRQHAAARSCELTTDTQNGRLRPRRSSGSPSRDPCRRWWCRRAGR